MAAAQQTEKESKKRMGEYIYGKKNSRDHK